MDGVDHRVDRSSQMETERLNEIYWLGTASSIASVLNDIVLTLSRRPCDPSSGPDAYARVPGNVDIGHRRAQTITHPEWCAGFSKGGDTRH